MFLFWGKEHTCFYNDAFRPVLGNEGKHPLAIGSPGELVWAEMWDSIRPMIDQALSGKSTGIYEDLYLPLYRNGKLEDAYWTFSYNPVKNDEGIVQGVLAICHETTEKVAEKKAAEEMQKQLHFALEAGDLGTWELDPKTMVFGCNNKTKEIFGLAHNENVDLKTAVDVIHSDDRERVRLSINNAFNVASGGRYDVQYTVIHPVSKEQKIVQAKGKAHFNEEGEAEKFTGTIQDITAERLAKRRREKLQQLVDNSKDYMSMATLDGQLTYMNTTGRTLLGIPIDEDLSSLHISDFYSSQEFAMVKNEIIPSMHANGQWSGLVKVKHQQTGEEIPCHGDYILIKDPINGKVISRGLTLHDLRPELQARKELGDSEKRFRNLVQEAPVATAIYIGEEMRIQWANDAMIKLWGKDKSVIGKTVREALPELEGQSFHGLLNQVYTTGEIYQASEDKGDLVVDGELQTFYFNFSYKPLRDTNGKVYGILNMAIDVTEQIKTKRKLEESDKNFRKLIMHAPVGICLITGDNNVVEIANDEYLQLVGRQQEELVGLPVWIALPEAKKQGFDVLLNSVKASGEAYFGYEQPVELLRNGITETVYVNFVYEPLFDEEKNAHSILVVAINVTQQVKARRSIEDAEERARLAVESAKLGTYEYNIQTGEMIASVRFNELFDIGADHLQPDYVSKIHPDDLAVRQMAHEKFYATGKLEYECRIVREDASFNWLRIFGQVYFDSEGNRHKIVGIAQDITEQKIVEEEREKFLSLSHYSRDFIGMCDMNMKTLYINKAGIEMLGIDGDIREANLWDCFFEEDRAYLRDSFFPAVQQTGHGEVEIRFRHFKTGAPVWVIYSVFLINNGKGEPSVMATVSRDITERKNMEAELEKRVKERTAELLKLNNELQQFTYVSSHDLKEPLRKIQFFGSVAKQEVNPVNAKLTNNLDKIINSANRMSTLLTDLLNYSTLSNSERQFGPVDLNRIFDHIEDDTELIIKEKNATITRGNLPVIEGISFQITQLFFNLVSNALKFSKEDKLPVVQVQASLLSESEKQNFPSLLPATTYYNISITDNGIGFKPEFAERIFVVFQRLNDRGQYAGNGIGLSLCKKIVENHRGEIHAHSEFGVGSTFTVLLPESQR